MLKLGTISVYTSQLFSATVTGNQPIGMTVVVRCWRHTHCSGPAFNDRTGAALITRWQQYTLVDTRFYIIKLSMWADCPMQHQTSRSFGFNRSSRVVLAMMHIYLTGRQALSFIIMQCNTLITIIQSFSINKRRIMFI